MSSNEYVREFEDILRQPVTGYLAHNFDGALDYLYQHRNDMTKDEFAECVASYGNAVYKEG